MTPVPSKQQQQFTIPSQLSKLKLSLKSEKIIRKQNLRNKANIPKMKVDSQNQDLQQQEQMLAKKKARKWWRKCDKKYFKIFQNIQQAEIEINKVQQLPINKEKLCTFFQEQFCQQQMNDKAIYLSSKDTLRVLFRRQTIIDETEQNVLFFYRLNENSSQIAQSQTVCDFINLNGQKIDIELNEPEKIPSNIHMFSFRNPIKDSRTNENKPYSTQKSTYNPIPQQLIFCSMQNSDQLIQKLLRHEKQHQSMLSLDKQLSLWTKKYHQIFEQNQQSIQNLAFKIQKNIQARKLQQQLKQRQQQILQITQQQLLWSQILLLFKKGHSDKTQQLLSDAQQILNIKQMNMKDSLKKKKTNSLQKLKSLFQTDCKICFSTENDEKINKVFYCDGCNTSFHQVCYGISKDQAQQILKMDKFYCDACSYCINLKTKLSSKKIPSGTNLQKIVSTASIQNGNRFNNEQVYKEQKSRQPSVKQQKTKKSVLSQKLQQKTKKPSCQLCCKANFPMKMLNQHFYHVTCLFMFGLAQVQQSKIIINPAFKFQQIIETVCQNQIESSFCQFCLKYQGMKFKCRQNSCSKWFHPICAYLNGVQFDLKRNFRTLDVNLFCYDHQIKSARNLLNQIYIRRFFCDYKKTSNLTEQKFNEEFTKQMKSIQKDRAKEMMNKNLLFKRNKTKNGATKGNVAQSFNQFNQQKLQQSIAQSSQMNQLDIQRNQMFQKIDHARFIQQDIEFD